MRFHPFLRARLAAPLVVALALAGSAPAQTPFEACGFIVSDGTCAPLFQPDGSSGYLLLANYGGFQLGHRVHVTGMAQSCSTTCQTGTCIFSNTIDACAPCNCVPYCFGTGAAVACPCGNPGVLGNGCANSAFAAGAQLFVTGGTSLSDDDTLFIGWQMPNSAALYFQGTDTVEAVFGDGKRCAGGAVLRLATKTNVNGRSSYPGPGEPRVSVLAGLTGPATRRYQVWYRDPATFCTTATHNLSNGVRIDWAL